jgi:hypothetical protein
VVEVGVSVEVEAGAVTAVLVVQDVVPDHLLQGALEDEVEEEEAVPVADFLATEDFSEAGEVRLEAADGVRLEAGAAFSEAEGAVPDDGEALLRPSAVVAILPSAHLAIVRTFWTKCSKSGGD